VTAARDDLFPVFDVALGDAEIEAVVATLRSGWLTMGPRTEEFEQAFAEHLGVPHAVALSSCTAALHLAYRAAGVGPGDEVIVPAITFVATAAAARYCGATPVLADVKGTHDIGIDPADAEARITDRTRAICAVHYAGYGADLPALERLCSERGIALIEDAAHSPAATLAGDERLLGTRGLAGCFSFFSNKVLSCGEGGLLATGDDEVARVARLLRSHAMTSGTWDRHRGHSIGYDVVDLGFNYRMDEARAALLTARLPGLAADIDRRRRVVRRYRDALGEVNGIKVPYSDAEVSSSTCYSMPVLVEDPAVRDPLRAWMLAERGIQTSVLYPSIADFTAYRDAAAEPPPNAARVAATQITLPLFPNLDEARQNRVVAALTDGLEAVRPS
jgi:dTDP-4-amino-4,6-dideoxygalactose transaminase